MTLSPTPPQAGYRNALAVPLLRYLEVGIAPHRYG